MKHCPRRGAARDGRAGQLRRAREHHVGGHAVPPGTCGSWVATRTGRRTALEHELSALRHRPSRTARVWRVMFPAWMEYVYDANPARFALYGREVFGLAPTGDVRMPTRCRPSTRRGMFFASSGHAHDALPSWGVTRRHPKMPSTRCIPTLRDNKGETVRQLQEANHGRRRRDLSPGFVGFRRPAGRRTDSTLWAAVAPGLRAFPKACVPKYAAPSRTHEFRAPQRPSLTLMDLGCFWAKDKGTVPFPILITRGRVICQVDGLVGLNP